MSDDAILASTGRSLALAGARQSSMQTKAASAAASGGPKGPLKGATLAGAAAGMATPMSHLSTQLSVVQTIKTTRAALAKAEADLLQATKPEVIKKLREDIKKYKKDLNDLLERLRATRKLIMETYPKVTEVLRKIF